MQSKRTTMQDIADACGLSRNTVSKAFNNRGSVPQATRDLIFQKARELAYGAPAAQAFQPTADTESAIALFTNNLPANYHFGNYLVTSFTDQISRAGYTLKLFEISQEELRSKRLPQHFNPSRTAGIIGIECFDPEYLDLLCDLNLPTILIDTPPHAYERLLRCDYVMMENFSSIIALVKHLHECGARRMGFVGDAEHCGSFNERWNGFCAGLKALNLALDESCCILDSDDSPYSNLDWMTERLARIPCLPEAFICANDYLAVSLMSALKRLGKRIPEEVMVTGFDGTTQSTLIEPALTTVQIPCAEIGRASADLLIARIRNPGLPFSWTHIKTTPVMRGSTKREQG